MRKNKIFRVFIYLTFSLLYINPAFSQGYTNSDIEINNKLNLIFDTLSKKVSSVQTDEGNIPGSAFIKDGILPKYSGQKVRILYLARECIIQHEERGENYVEVMNTAYKEQQVGAYPLNRYAFHRKMFKITYGLNHDSDWDKIPKPTEMNYPSDVSFAIMEFSKIGNESGDWKTDSSRFNSFVSTVSNYYPQFWSEEIEIIDPDVIIGMNINEFGNYYNYLGIIQQIEKDLELGVTAYWLILPNGAKKLLIDTYHFSSRKKESKFFYEPIRELYKKYKGQITRGNFTPIKSIEKGSLPQNVLDAVSRMKKYNIEIDKIKNQSEAILKGKGITIERGFYALWIGNNMYSFKQFNNHDELPSNTGGTRIIYTEMDVNPKPEHGTRDSLRIIRGSDGSFYYTKDHYQTFTKVE